MILRRKPASRVMHGKAWDYLSGRSRTGVVRSARSHSARAVAKAIARAESGPKAINRFSISLPMIDRCG
jgi:hypothetical protein